MTSPDSCLIDDFGPLPVARPASAAELGDLVRHAATTAIYPMGGRTMLGLGGKPSRPGHAVDLRSLASVIDYPARDMTITVQAGITLASLHAILAAENQRLPIDVPRPAEATLGGAMAANVSGSRRFGWGTLRDYVIGISTINDEGQETKAGGRVVKNVAGYDLCKLHIGALGTLGVISQVTLKVRPRLEANALMTLSCSGYGLEALLILVHQTRTRPVSIDLLNRGAARKLAGTNGVELPYSEWLLIVGFEESDSAVSWQVGQLMTEAASVSGISVEARAGSACDPLWHGLAELPLDSTALLSFKANLLPSAVAAFCAMASTLPEEPALFAQVGSGIVYGHVAEITEERGQEVAKNLLEAAVAAQGNLVITQCPSAWKAKLSVWGKSRGDGAVMRQVKQALDPRGIFNPGRFVEGI